MDNIKDLKTRVNDKWLDLIISPISNTQNPVEFIIKGEYKEFSDLLGPLTREEKKWFLELVKKQQERTGYVDLLNTLRTYRVFINNLHMMGLSVHNDMPLPEDGNIKVALDILLYVIRSTPAQLQKKQLSLINSSTDITTSGIWYARRHDRFKLITNEMNFTAGTSFNGSYRSAFLDPEVFAVNKAFLLMQLNNYEKTTTDFYRYLGSQAHLGPYKNYALFCKKIQAKTTDAMTNNISIRLCSQAMIIMGTTGKKEKILPNRI